MTATQAMKTCPTCDQPVLDGASVCWCGHQFAPTATGTTATTGQRLPSSDGAASSSPLIALSPSVQASQPAQRGSRAVAVGVCVAAVVVALLVVLLAGGSHRASATDGAFLSACNRAETSSLDSGGPPFSCACVLSKARAAPGSTPGAGGYPAEYISQQATSIKATEDKGNMPAAVIEFAVAFRSSVNAC